MKKNACLLAALLLAAPAAFAYQVTGPVLEVSDTKIVVEKGKEKWEIERNKDTKITGDVKKGSRVTIQYRMTADSIESKDAAKADAKKDAKPAKK
jgi:hypothetical protein